MEGYIVLTVRYGGSCKLFTVNSQSSFEDLISKIKNNWSTFSHEFVTYRCRIGEITDVSMDSQADFVNMFMLCELSKINIVAVDVVDIEMSLKGAGCAIDVNQSGLVTNQSQQSADLPSSSRDVAGLPVNNPSTILSKQWSNVLSMVVGFQLKGNVFDFRNALVKYSFGVGFRFHYRRNTSERIVAYCREALTLGCKWFIKAKLDVFSEAFVVYDVCGDHSCLDKLFVRPSDKNFCPKAIGDLLTHHARKNPEFKAKDVIDAMKISYGVDIPYWKARRAAISAKDKLLGSFSQSYDLISSYCEVLLSTNPGSVVALEVNKSTNVFERVFIAFNSSLKGFMYYRPILFVDGTFLKGRVKGTLMVATAKDGNNGLFPVGIALVSAENTDNWVWFFTQLRDSVAHNKEISYLSDRNTGLVAALSLVFKEPSPFFCLVHLITNLNGRFTGRSNKGFRGVIVKLFKECAYAPTKEEFDTRMAIFKDVGGPVVDDWLLQLPKEKWALAYSPIMSRFGEMTSNAVESFNNWILEDRSKPITQMFEHIRSGMSGWVVEHRLTSNSWTGILVPIKQALWDQLTEIGNTWNVVPCPAGVYEVLSSPSVCVDLESRYCSCFQWQHTGFPCCLAVAVIKKVRLSVDRDIKECFFTSNYRKCYSWDLNPVLESLMLDIWMNSKTDIVTGPPIIGVNRVVPKFKRGSPHILNFVSRRSQRSSVNAVGSIPITMILHVEKIKLSLHRMPLTPDYLIEAYAFLLNYYQIVIMVPS